MSITLNVPLGRFNIPSTLLPTQVERGASQCRMFVMNQASCVLASSCRVTCIRAEDGVSPL